MWRDKRNNKESDENNKKMTRGRKIIRATKNKTPKSGDRPSMYACNCGKIIRGADGSCGRGHVRTERKWMKQQLQ